MCLAPVTAIRELKKIFAWPLLVHVHLTKILTVTKVAYFSNHVVEGTGSMIQESLILFLLR